MCAGQGGGQRVCEVQVCASCAASILQTFRCSWRGSGAGQSRGRRPLLLTHATAGMLHLRVHAWLDPTPTIERHHAHGRSSFVPLNACGNQETSPQGGLCACNCRSKAPTHWRTHRQRCAGRLAYLCCCISETKLTNSAPRSAHAARRWDPPKCHDRARQARAGLHCL